MITPQLVDNKPKIIKPHETKVLWKCVNIVDIRYHTKESAKPGEQKGHYSVVCQSKPYKQYNKPVKQLQQSASSEDEDPQASYKFDHLSWKLDQVPTGKVVSSPCTEYNTLVTIRIQDQRLKVQVDSGAEVNVMDYATYQAIHKRHPLRNTSAKLKPCGSKPLPVKGCFKTAVRANGQEVKSM